MIFPDVPDFIDKWDPTETTIMEGLTGSPEVEAEIRRAIVAKLEELNAYVDDELPAYIMVSFFQT